MPNNSSTTHGEETVVAKHSIGEKIIDSLRNSFTGGGKIRRGDFYMNQSHDLLQRYLRIIDVNERHSIMETYIELVPKFQIYYTFSEVQCDRAKESKKKFEASSFRYFKAAEYKSLCKETFEIVAVSSYHNPYISKACNPLAARVQPCWQQQSHMSDSWCSGGYG